MTAPHYGLAEPLHGMPAWALAGGTGLFLLGAAAILLRTTGHRAPALIAGGLGCVAAGPLVALSPGPGSPDGDDHSCLLLHSRASRGGAAGEG